MLSRLIFATLIITCISVAHGADIRYCGEPIRHTDGRIKRSRATIAAFIALYPLPSGFNRDDYQINHAVPLVCGGCDTIENMLWMHVKAKTCADDYCQDRNEQLTMCPKRYHK